MSDTKISMRKLRELERRKVTFINVLSDIQLEINGILSKFQKIDVDSWDGSGTYEDGKHVINAPAEKVEAVIQIESGYKGNFVTFKTGITMKLEDYFTPDEVESIRKY